LKDDKLAFIETIDDKIAQIYQCSVLFRLHDSCRTMFENKNIIAVPRSYPAKWRSGCPEEQIHTGIAMLFSIGA